MCIRDRVKAQPIAIEDVIAYLVAAQDLPLEQSAVFEIGGPDQVSYGEIMREYARQCGLRRWMIPVPVLTPHLSSLWLGLVTPIYARVGRKPVSYTHLDVYKRQVQFRVHMKCAIPLTSGYTASRDIGAQGKCLTCRESPTVGEAVL